MGKETREGEGRRVRDKGRRIDRFRYNGEDTVVVCVLNREAPIYFFSDSDV